MQITLMSWNLWHGEFLDDIIAFIKRQNADIIALQEVVDLPGEPRMAARIAEATGYHYAHFKAFTNDRHDPPDDQGNTILSRFQIEAASAHALSSLDDYDGTAETEPRIAVKVCVRAGSSGLAVLNTHLAHTTDLKSCRTRLRQIDNLLALVEPQRTVLMGDFNVEPGSEELARVRRVLHNADPDPTAPTAFLYDHDKANGHYERTEPHVRIDHIFVTPDIRVRSFEILDTLASDHYPILAVVEV